MATRFQEKDKYTYEDYLKTPDDERFELIEGELLMTPTPNIFHQSICGVLFMKASQYVIERKLGKVFFAPCDVVLGNENVFEPDILFVSNENSGIINKANIKGAPDLTIEVLLPSTAYRDLVKKKRIYAEHGVREYWIIDPEEKTAELFILHGEQFDLKNRYSMSGVMESEILKGLCIPVQEIFGK